MKDYQRFVNFIEKYNLCWQDVYDIKKDSFDIFFMRDNNLNTIWTNKKQYFLNKYNISERDFFGSPCYKVLFKLDEPCTDCPVCKSKITGKPEEGEVRLKNDNIILVRSHPIKKHDEIIGSVDIVFNITEKREIKNKLRYKNNKLDMFMNLSHEFRTPLSLMHTSLQMAKKRFKNTNLNEDEKKKFNVYMNTIQNNNYRLLKLVNNLLDLNKINAGKYNINIQNDNIVKLVKKVTTSSAKYAESQQKKITFNSDIKKKVISIDPFEIERVILNLISNALKFTAPGDIISVNIKEDSSNVLICVKDTGIGIPENKQKLIFDKFNQVDSSINRSNEGSGLGLSIVKLIIEMHKGEIKLNSKVGKGSEFIIKLPIRKICDDDIEDYNKKCNNIINNLNIEFSDIY